MPEQRRRPYGRRTCRKPELDPVLKELTMPAVLAEAAVLVTPGDPGWDDARGAWNLAVDQRPAAVAVPRSAEEVVAAVTFARERGLRVAAQGTGHNAAPLGSLADTLLVKTSRMRQVTIDPAARVARAEAGAVWLDVVEAAAEHGLAGLAGSSPDVGVVGYTLGGGMGWLGRAYGLSANNVEAIEVVTADGRLLRTDGCTERDLFWALRGGGGSFGVVTAIELRLFPISEVYAGLLWWPADAAPRVLPAWQQLTCSGLPDEFTTSAVLSNFPPVPEVPEQLRGRSFVVIDAIHLGSPAEADELLAPLRELAPVTDTIATISMPALSHLHVDFGHPVPGSGDGLLLASLPPEAIDTIVRVAGPGSPPPQLGIEIRHLGGEMSRSRPANGAQAAYDAQYALFAVAAAPTPEAASSAERAVAALTSAMTPWAAGHTCLNLTETRRDPASFWSPQAYARLRLIKAAVDPHNMIRSNHPIPPAAPASPDPALATTNRY
jgi:FAD/FMN-containing dehydrogenase